MMKMRRKTIGRTSAVLLAVVLVFSLFPLFGSGAAYIPDYQYNAELGGFYVTVDGERYLIAPNNTDSETLYTGFSAASTIFSDSGSEIEVHVYSPYKKAKDENDPDFERFPENQIYVDFWVSNITTNTGAIGLEYDPSILLPSKVETNELIADESEIDEFTIVPHTVVWTDDPSLEVGQTVPLAAALSLENEGVEEPETTDEPTPTPEPETTDEPDPPPEPENTDEPKTPDLGDDLMTGVTGAADGIYTTVYLDELFFAVGDLIDAPYVGMNMADNYVTLQYCPDYFFDGFDAWSTLGNKGLSNLQLKVEDSEEGMVMSRMSFQLQSGKKLTYGTFDYSNLRYYDNDSVERLTDFSVFIQDGTAVLVGSEQYLPSTTDSTIITFVGIPYPPPPHEPTAENHGDDSATIYIPAVSYDGVVLDKIPSSMSFRVYYEDTGGSFVLLPDSFVTDYVYGIPDPDGGSITGVTFLLTIPDGPAYDEVRGILQDGGVLHVSTMYLGVESKIHVGADPDDYTNDTEIARTPVIIKKAIEYTGFVVSWAPTHETTLSLYPEYDSGNPLDVDDGEGYSTTPAYTITMSEEDGAGQYSQEFAFKSSNLVGTYKLVIEKASHITYTEAGIVITEPAITDPTDPVYDPSAADFRQSYGEDITLFCGDIDGDGRINQNDRNHLQEYVNNPSLWRDGAASPANPANITYLMDLDGDGNITVFDLNILMHSDNYSKTAKDYAS